MPCGPAKHQGDGEHLHQTNVREGSLWNCLLIVVLSDSFWTFDLGRTARQQALEPVEDVACCRPSGGRAQAKRRF